MGTTTTNPATPADESHAWWGVFLDARMAALQAMDRLGRSPAEMLDTLNLADESHALRILMHPLNREPEDNGDD